VAEALIAGLAVGGVHTAWLAEADVGVTVVAVICSFPIAGAVPVRADLVAHAAVWDHAADATLGVTRETGWAVPISRAAVRVANTIVTNLGIRTTL